MKRLLPLLTFGLLSLLSARAAVYDWTAEPLKDVKIQTVAFRAWTPDGAKDPLRGTIILIPGRHGDGRPLSGDKRWQQLATDLNFAIIACQFTNGEPGLYQEDAHGEVAKCLNGAVKHLATEANQPALEKGPLVFWGHSAGSNVSSQYCKFFPDRVAAFTSSKGTWGPSGAVTPKTMEIPMFFALGEKDRPDFLSASKANIEKGLGKAPWTLALNVNEGHAIGGSLDVIFPFLEVVVKQRLGLAAPASSADSLFKSQLPAIGSSSSMGPSKNLKKIDLHDGWLGDPKTYEISTYANFKGTKSKGIWLPDETTAKAWQAYLKSSGSEAPKADEVKE